jgi:hypothetical protein
VPIGGRTGWDKKAGLRSSHGDRTRRDRVQAALRMKASAATAETKDQHDSRREQNRRKVSAVAPQTGESTREIQRDLGTDRIKSEVANEKMETDGTPGHTRN